MHAPHLDLPPGHWEQMSEPRAGALPNAAGTPEERERILRAGDEQFAPFRGALRYTRDEARLHAVAAMFDPPAWERGGIRVIEALILDEFVAALRPACVLEIGVASGISSAVLLHAMRRSGADPRATWLHSADVLPHCYFDRSRPVGAAVTEMTPHLRDRWSLHRTDAHGLAERLAGRRFPLAFIDGDHRHPWATLDLLALAPVLEPGAWVILHDVALARINDALRSREGRPAPRSEYGPETLFAAFPGTKVIGNGWAGNTAAMLVDDPAALTPAFLGASLARAWEVHPPGAVEPGTNAA